MSSFTGDYTELLLFFGESVTYIALFQFLQIRHPWNHVTTAQVDATVMAFVVHKGVNVTMGMPGTIAVTVRRRHIDRHATITVSMAEH